MSHNKTTGATPVAVGIELAKHLHQQLLLLVSIARAKKPVVTKKKPVVEKKPPSAFLTQ